MKFSVLPQTEMLHYHMKTLIKMANVLEYTLEIKLIYPHMQFRFDLLKTTAHIGRHRFAFWLIFMHIVTFSIILSFRFTGK